MKQITVEILSSFYAYLLITVAECYTQDNFHGKPANSILGEMNLTSARISVPVLRHATDSTDNSIISGFTYAPPPNSTSVKAVKKRSKRFIYFNINASLDFGFLLTIPITIVLPPLSNLFNRWKYSKRSLRSLEDNEDVVYEDHPVIQPYLDRVNSYFELIKIPEPACQQRAICEFSSDPDHYFPISNLILNQIRDPALTTFFYDEELRNPNGTQQSLFKQFNGAAEKGLAYGQTACQKEYFTQCPYSMDTRLNIPLLKFWQGLQTLLKMEFQND